MAGGVKRNRGNKKMGAWERIDVPKTSYKEPTPYPITPPEQPIDPIEERVCVKSVIIYEVSPTYEGNPKKPIGTMWKIPIEHIIGCPITAESLGKGYSLTTTQGEVLQVRWYTPMHLTKPDVKDLLAKYQGVMIHVKDIPNRDPFYDTEWGHIYGVGIEWESESMSGISWAKRFGAHFSDGNLVNTKGYPQNIVHNAGADDHDPHVIRGGLMLGDPMPKRTVEAMGAGLPLQVLPALGAKGNGTVFAFNPNVSRSIRIAPPTIPYVTMGQEGTTPSGDVVNIQWGKDDYAIKTRLMLKFTSGIPINVYGNTNLAPNGSGEWWLNDVTTSPTGFASYTVKFDPNSQYTYEVLLWEVDDSGNPVRKIAGVRRHEDWANTANAYTEPISTDEIPLHPDPCGCGQTSPPDNDDPGNGDPGDGGGGTTPPPTGQEPDTVPNIKFFCDNSVNPSIIDTDYWNIPAFGINPKFWEGYNQLMQAMNYSRLIITKKNFHDFLWLLIKKSKEGKVFEQGLNKDFQSFMQWANTNAAGITCLNKYQKASVWMSYRLKIPVIFVENPRLDPYLDGTRLDYMAQYINKTKTFAYDFLSFQDVLTDSQSSGVGAFNSDPTPANPTTLRGFKSFVNMEPEGLLFKQNLPYLGEVFPANLTDAFKPWDYITTGSSGSSISSPMWNPTNPVPNPYNPTYWTDAQMYDQNKDGLIAAQIAVHEMGHALSAYAFDTCGKALDQTREWMNIIGHTDPNYQTTTHRIFKSKGIHETGGMPKTDTGHEAPVSSYGCMNTQDAFAEAYRFYIFNPKFLQDKHPQQFDFMEKYVKPMTESNVICPTII